MNQHFDVPPQAKYVRGRLSPPPRRGTVTFTCANSSMVIRDERSDFVVGDLVGDCSRNGWIDHESGSFYFEPRIRYFEVKRWTACYETEEVRL
jgi:hypothetical protein